LLIAVRLFACPAYSSALKMETGRFSQTPWNFYRTTRHRIPEDGPLQLWFIFDGFYILLLCVFANNPFLDKAQSTISYHPLCKKEHFINTGPPLSTGVVKLHP
jgi:hypothetical protein